MAKFYGNIGFTIQAEAAPDIWEPVEKIIPYQGDLRRNQRRWSNGESVNEDIDVSNEISIMADDFIMENVGSVKWAEVMGARWKVNSVTIEYPRVTLTLGGVYNGG